MRFVQFLFFRHALGANNREIPDMIDVSGLSEKEVAALKLIIDSMKGRK